MKLIREPLVHFLFAGALLFGVYAWLNPSVPGEQSGEAVQIGEGEIVWLRQTFANQWRRDPTPDEMAGLVATLVDEELLAREARAVGLDRNDTIVRRRLAQKMDFLAADTARIVEPEDAQLRGFYEAHDERYRTAAKISFSQIYFNPRDRADAEADATAALRLTSGDAATWPADGDRLLLDSAYGDLDRQAVDSLFGPAFAQAIFALPSGAWHGPVMSAFGVHLVKTRDPRPAQLRPFEDVRDAVAADWRRERDIAAHASYMEKLRAKYGVMIAGEAQQSTPMAVAGRLAR